VKRILALLALLGLWGPAGAAVSTVQMIDVGAGDFAFSPQVVYVAQGDTVRWVNSSSATHTASSGITPATLDGLWDSGFLGPGGSFQFRFDNSGSFRYFCQIHNRMTGLVRVSRANIQFNNLAYVPSSVTVSAGDTVIFTNVDPVSHTTTSGASPVPDGLWDSGLVGPGGSFNLATSGIPVGPHSFFCGVHNFMTGTISITHSATGVGGAVRAANRLLAPRPNPARTRVGLGYELAADGPVRVLILDASGRRVRTVVDRVESAGRHAASWDGRDDAGGAVSAGSYFVRLDRGAVRLNRKLTWIR
jgi:plastocyanin